MAEHIHEGTSADGRTRRRAIVALFVTAALMNAAMAAVSPAAMLYASNYLGVAWSAVPQCATILGTGLGALLVSRATGRWTWRASLAAAYTTATVGALLAFVAALGAIIPLLCLGMLLLGLGAGGAMISRYAAAELYPARRRGFAIGMVVAAGSVGSIGGPLLLTPVSALMHHIGWPDLSGPFLLAAATSAIAGSGLITLPSRRFAPEEGKPVAVRDLFRGRSSRMLLGVMLTGQLVMTAIMTAAPMDIYMNHGSLTMVGTALSAHITGMFVLSPVTGWVIDRIGARPVMFAGFATLVAAAVLAATAPGSQPLLGDLALFLLGYGWNLCFMSGSRTLAVILPTGARGPVVGMVDAIVWSVSATATLTGTGLLATGGYAVLSEIVGCLPILTAIILFRSGLRFDVATVRSAQTEQDRHETDDETDDDVSQAA